MAQFNLIDLYSKAFGYVATPYFKASDDINKFFGNQLGGQIGTPYLTAKPKSYIPLGSLFLDKAKVPEFKAKEYTALGTPLFMP